ncbi:life-span regulatory factor-domain-containing protein [Aspergillus caelatus]|uniref:Life-span regulatory factor-domain-containing protein n=2 Tax=Aspergillus subgen. Circumdati TaxID=2720871 RepID=A0A5N6ZTV0_9EURO|nr:life-span regulatory factor-domain-containing protein [Aspergillus caelatus]KAE8360359.1 life-span regulatory factor-domain-containing protein [Aspergillus caelatus]KAE8413467.1 life-span regulatory factor-domain-containing protein [Aspergillus pseudocaelatus]
MTQGNFSFHHRRSPSGSCASKLRTVRPALHRKGTSFVNHSISKLGAGHTRHSESDNDCQSEMAASFLNFCAMCERQITVPDNSRLYCSESCRRKDSHKPLSASFTSNHTMPSSTTPPSSPPMSPRTIVPPMTPTKAPITSTQVTRILGEFHDSKTDQDPSEWKPVIPMGTNGSASPASSEAWQYLSQFHSGSAPVPMRRPRVEHRSSASLFTLLGSTGAPPSLTHTPSTAASSFSSNASDSYLNELAHRPLPPRRKSYFSGSANGAKGVELVVPHMGVRVGDSTVDMNRGSIFPASSGLWGDHNDKCPATVRISGSVPLHTPVRPQ